MDFNITDLIKKVQDDVQHDTFKIDNKVFSKKTGLLIDALEPEPEPHKLETLTGLIDYLKNGIDKIDVKDFMIHIYNGCEVGLVKYHNDRLKSHVYVHCTHSPVHITIDQYMSIERTLIELQSKYQPTDDREALLEQLKFVSTDSNVEFKDDGMAQEVTMKAGIHTKEKGEIQAINNLKPVRIFHEASQPESQFLIRLKRGENQPIQCAIFEADGGAWKNRAILNIKQYLEGELKKAYGEIPIIA